MIEFLSEKRILYECHSSFRKNHSTGANFTFDVEKISKGLEKGGVTEIIWTDLQKDFDNTNCEILAIKLSHMGFS